MAALTEAVVLGPGGRLATARDGRMTIEARAEQTGDAFAMVEWRCLWTPSGHRRICITPATRRSTFWKGR
jgi:hypothetical protein